MLATMASPRFVFGGALGALVIAVVACVGEDPQPNPTSTDAGAESGSGSSSSSSSSGSSSGDAGSAQVGCSGAQCGPSEVCCALNSEKWVNAGCRPTCGDRELACDGPEDCPKGQSCCAEIGATPPGLQGAHCATTCPKLANALCHSPADCGGSPCTVFDTAAGDFPSFVKRCSP